MIALKSIPMHRRIVVIWHLFVLAMLLWAFFSWRDGGEIHWIWLALIATPLLVLLASLSKIKGNHRSLAYWVLAAACIPSAGAGITSIVGLMFVISVIMLIWAAMRENPAEEMVQM